MRRVMLAATILVGMLLAPVAAQEWYRLESKEGAFTVSFPAQPKYAAVPILGRPYHHWVYEMPDKSATYLVGYFDYPPGHVAKSGGVQVLLSEITKGSHEGLKGGPLSEKPIKHSGYLAREIVFRTSAGHMYRQRQMVVGDRGYIWNYVGAPGSENGPSVKRFLDSLVVQRR